MQKSYKVKKVEKSEADNVRDYNVGASDYAKHKIQTWVIVSAGGAASIAVSKGELKKMLTAITE